MINITKVKDNFKVWILGQADKLAVTNPIIKFSKPLIKRSIDKKLKTIDSYLEWITDSEGNIDVKGILDETILNIQEPEVCSIEVPLLGNVEMGNGKIYMNIPMTDKRILFTVEDLEFLKETLIG